jgi:heavy metal translocating P-type ATPase
MERRAAPWLSIESGIAVLSAAALVAYGVLRLVFRLDGSAAAWPLWVAMACGGAPLVVSIGRQLVRGMFGTDLLAGVAIVVAALQHEFVVGAVIVLMLSGGQALEGYATRRASALLDALARRTPGVAHRREGSTLVDIPLDDVHPGDELEVLPHELCPVDGVVVAGHSRMDESYVSGEPFLIEKTIGVAVISGSQNGDGSLTVLAKRRPVDSRYARIVNILREADQHRPRLRRLGDRLGAWYTPLALGVAAAAWMWSGVPSRFLAVLVIATPCPLLLAIPIAILGAISLAAARGILIRNPTILERARTCRTAILDKTGTLTLGRPSLTSVITVAHLSRREVLGFASSLEQYSKHPLAPAVLAAAHADRVERRPAEAVSEHPGEGLSGRIAGHDVRLSGRRQISPEQVAMLPPTESGLECVVTVDGVVVAVLRFRDTPRRESPAFIHHLGPRHGITRLILTSGDRESEVRYLAEHVGITDVRFAQSPEDKVDLVVAETRRQPTLFIGDGINDAPAMLAATVSVALGQQHDVAAEAADAIVLEGSLSRVDELLHISARARRIALESAIGGMVLSLVGMAAAAAGWLPPLVGATAQEVIDVVAVLNALRAAYPPRVLTDYQ